MSSFVPDFDAIVQSVLELEVSPVAKEAGAGLADHWVRECCAADSQEKIRGVELGFVFALDEKTYAVGVQDRIWEDADGVVGDEYKTTAAASRYWNESKWLASIKNGSQVGLYALALRKGTYYEAGMEPFQVNAERPRIRVRAVSKSSPPQIWPSDAEDAWITFSDADLVAVENAYRAKAEAIRSVRRLGLIPFQLPGIQCNKFNRDCPLLENYCGPKRYLTFEAVGGFDQSDPAASLAIPHIPPAVLADPDLVILSASAYSSATECLELHRNIISGQNTDAKEESAALQTGTCLHAAVAEYHRQIRRSQENVR